MSLCNGCTNTLRVVNHQLSQDTIKKDQINSELSKIGKEFRGTVEVKHFVDVFKDEVGVDKIKTFLTKDLSKLKVACHPGCHYMRPSEFMEADDPMNPTNLKELVAASGATVIDYEELALCCGAAVTNAYEEHGLANLKIKMDSIKKSGADVIVVNCPACFQQLDTHQRDLSKKFDTEYNIPILYLTELYALAMGFSPEELGLKFHRTKLSRVLEKLEL
jgi:heterodisulfide reductase subunit B